MEVINWRLVKHPLNWVTVFLMVFLVWLAAHFVLSYFKGLKSAAKQATPNPDAQAAQYGVPTPGPINNPGGM